MSNTKPEPTTKVEEPYKFDDKRFTDKLAELIKSRDAAAGKEGVNTYIWYRDNVQMKEKAYKDGDRSKTLYETLMAVTPFALPK